MQNNFETSTIDHKSSNLYDQTDKNIDINFTDISWEKIISKVIILIIILSFYKFYKNKISLVAPEINNNKNYYNNSKENLITLKRDDFNYIDKITFYNGSLYWNNETSLNIHKILKEIKNFTPLICYDNKTNFEKRELPIISLIITLHNQENYIKLIYSSIQNQELKDIEIIFVDDCSEDNSTSIVQELMEKDKRIIYLKNLINKGAYYSRNKGILKAKGEYILCVDPDDMLVNNILIKAYKTAKKYKLDIVHFYVLKGYYKSPKLWSELKYKSGILKNNAEIKNNFYHCISRNLWDKLVKAKIFKKAANFMNREFYHELYFINNDNTIFFGLLHVAKTYGFLEQIGYFYITRPRGSYYYRKDPKNMNIIFRSIFNNMRYFYLQSDNTVEEKTYLAYEYFNKSMRLFGKYLSNITVGFDYIFKVLDLYLDSTYFNSSQKNNLIIFRVGIYQKIFFI